VSSFDPSIALEWGLEKDRSNCVASLLELTHAFCKEWFEYIMLQVSEEH